MDLSGPRASFVPSKALAEWSDFTRKYLFFRACVFGGWWYSCVFGAPVGVVGGCTLCANVKWRCVRCVRVHAPSRTPIGRSDAQGCSSCCLATRRAAEAGFFLSVFVGRAGLKDTHAHGIHTRLLERVRARIPWVIPHSATPPSSRWQQTRVRAQTLRRQSCPGEDVDCVGFMSQLWKFWNIHIFVGERKPFRWPLVQIKFRFIRKYHKSYLLWDSAVKAQKYACYSLPAGARRPVGNCSRVSGARNSCCK